MEANGEAASAAPTVLTADDLSLISGRVFALAGGFVFMKFTEPGAAEESVCYFRGHRIFEAGKKVKPAEVKTHARLKDLYDKRLEGSEVTAAAARLDKPAVFTGNSGESLGAGFYSHCVWTDGTAPPREEWAPKPKTEAELREQAEKKQNKSNNKKKEEPMAVEEASASPGDNSISSMLSALRGEAKPEKPAAKRDLWKAEGTLMHRGLTGEAVVSFSLPDDPTAGVQHAKFTADELLGVERAEFHSWPRDRQARVGFCAVRTGQPVEYGHACASGDDGMELEFGFVVNWSCYAVWMADQDPPPPDGVLESKINVARRRGALIRGAVEVTEDKMDDHEEDNEDDDFRELAKTCEYVSGKMSQFLDKSSGVMSTKDRHVLFKMQDLSVDGERVANSGAERLSSVLQMGDTLFSFCRPLRPPKTIDDKVVSLTAVQVRKLQFTCFLKMWQMFCRSQIWRGKRFEGQKKKETDGADGKKKTVVRRKFPLPSQATHLSQVSSRNSLQVGAAFSSFVSRPASSALSRTPLAWPHSSRRQTVRQTRPHPPRRGCSSAGTGCSSAGTRASAARSPSARTSPSAARSTSTWCGRTPRRRPASTSGWRPWRGSATSGRRPATP